MKMAKTDTLEISKEFFNSLRERFTNPFFFSFFVSWIIINWRVTVALLWYDAKQIEITSGHNYFCFIISNTNFYHSLLYPLLFALIYVFANQWIKSAIRWIYALANVWGDKMVKKETKDSHVPIKQFFDLKEIMDDRARQLEETYNKVTNSTLEYEKLKSDYTLLSNDKELLQGEKKLMEDELQGIQSKLIQIKDMGQIEGWWLNHFKYIPNKKAEHEIALIKDGKYMVYNSEKEHLIHKFNITDFSFDPDSKRMFFVKELTSGYIATNNVSNIHERGIIVVRLTLINSNYLIGKENLDYEVEYSRTNIQNVRINSE